MFASTAWPAFNSLRVRMLPQAPPAVIDAGETTNGFHVAEGKNSRGSRDDTLRDLFRGLLKLAEGFLAGTLRVFVMAWAFVTLTE